MIHALRAGLIILAIGLPGPMAAQNIQRKVLPQEERQACLADGGHVTIMWLLGGEGCVRPMPDAGKACTDGSQCQGRSCVLDERRPGFKPPRPDARVTGICAATDFPFGCAWRVHNGSISGMCMD